jgi:hypothetical protein
VLANFNGATPDEFPRFRSAGTVVLAPVPKDPPGGLLHVDGEYKPDKDIQPRCIPPSFSRPYLLIPSFNLLLCSSNRVSQSTRRVTGSEGYILPIYALDLGIKRHVYRLLRVIVYHYTIFQLVKSRGTKLRTVTFRNANQSLSTINTTPYDLHPTINQSNTNHHVLSGVPASRREGPSSLPPGRRRERRRCPWPTSRPRQSHSPRLHARTATQPLSIHFALPNAGYRCNSLRRRRTTHQRYLWRWPTLHIRWLDRRSDP